MSKLMLFDFRCEACNHTFEDLVQPINKWHPCPLCGEDAHRQISPVRIDHSAMAMQESASPASLAHFDRTHRSRKAIEEKSMRDHGDYGNKVHF